MGARSSWSWLVVGWALACGGRYERVDIEGDGGSATGPGGPATSQAAAPSRSGAGPGGPAGTSSGGTGTSVAGTGPIGAGASPSAGGVTNAGGVATGGACGCDPIACPSGYLTVPNADGCCFHCELDLNSCEQQRRDYAAYRQMLLGKYGQISCNVNAQCTRYFDKNQCGAWPCGFPIEASVWNSLDADLNTYAQANCNPACPPLLQPQPPCAAMPTPQCLNRSCN